MGSNWRRCTMGRVSFALAMEQSGG
ncbi:hypothetical protein BCEP4_490098 [Burkholderia cepacia]|nr:hypothetical protein BCEP4_490098 [Burkholderia cepacia]